MGAAIAGMSAACTADAPTSECGAGEELSGDAAEFRALMRWQGEPEIPDAEDAAALPAADEPADLAAIEAAVAAIGGDTVADLRFDPHDGRLGVETFEREIVRGPDHTDEPTLLAEMTSILVAMGADLDQAELSTSTLGATGGAMGEDSTTVGVAKKVHVERRILGQAISLEGGTATYDMDGRMISINLRWRRIDYDHSTLAVDGIACDADVMDFAAQMLADRQVERSPTLTAIDVATYYWPTDPRDPAGDLSTIALVASAAMEDSGVVHEAELDGGGPVGQ